MFYYDMYCVFYTRKEPSSFKELPAYFDYYIKSRILDRVVDIWWSQRVGNYRYVQFINPCAEVRNFRPPQLLSKQISLFFLSVKSWWKNVQCDYFNQGHLSKFFANWQLFKIIKMTTNILPSWCTAWVTRIICWKTIANCCDFYWLNLWKILSGTLVGVVAL